MTSIKGKAARQIGKMLPLALARPFGGPAVILFHGVEHRIEDAELQEMHHRAGTFRAAAKNLKANFDVLPLSAIDDVLRAPHRHRRALFFTSDDGYANTLTVAADILAELQLPWTLFVSTGHIETGKRNPMFLARLFCRFASPAAYDIPNFQHRLDLTADRRQAAAYAIMCLKNLGPRRADESLAAMLSCLSGGMLDELLARFPSERFLSWDKVTTLHRRGVEIGAHADMHWPMNRFRGAKELGDEASAVRQTIIEKIGSCQFFAYPFGQPEDISADAWQAVRDAGYSHAFTTVSGTLDAATNPWLLPRFGLPLNDTDPSSVISLLRMNNSRVRHLEAALCK